MRDNRIVNPIIRLSRTSIVIATASVLAFASPLVVTVSAHAATAPAALSFACSARSGPTGPVILRRATTSSCPRGATLIDFSIAFPVYTCRTKTSGALRRVSTRACRSTEALLTLPDIKAQTLCARRTGGILRSAVGRPCTSSEQALRLKPRAKVVATPDAMTIQEGDSVDIAVLANDTGPRALVLQSRSTAGTRGTITVSAKGVVTYSSANVAVDDRTSATDTFTYTVGTNPSSSTAVGTVLVTIVADPAAPEIRPIQASVTAPSTPLGTTTETGFSLYNAGELPTGPVTLTLSGANAAEFTVPTRFHTRCVGNIVAPGTTCGYRYDFTPIGLGARVAVVTATAVPGGTTTVTMTGWGIDS